MNKHLIYIIIFTCILLTGCGTQQKQQQIRTIKDIVNKKAIVISGSNQEAFMMKNYPKADVVHVQTAYMVFP